MCSGSQDGDHEVSTGKGIRLGKGQETLGDPEKGLIRGQAQHKPTESGQLVWKKAHLFSNTRRDYQNLKKIVHSFVHGSLCSSPFGQSITALIGT